MKTKIRKFVIPMVVALVAIAGAFASNLSQKDDTTAIMDKPGYLFQGAACVKTATICSTIQNSKLCTVGGHNLFEWNGTSCPINLYRK